MQLLVALDIDGTLIDTTPSFTRIVKELTGATTEEIWRFRDTGGFNDDWDLARALKAWLAAGRPEVLDPLPRDTTEVDAAKVARGGGLVDVHVVLERLERLGRFDPGDQAPAGIALYRSGYWRDERVLVDGAVLHALAARHRVAACTGRDAWEFARAEERLGFTFATHTTMEDVRKPDPHALLRLARADDDVIVLFGDTAADRMCVERARATGRDVRFVHVDPSTPARPLLEALAATDDVSALLPLA